MTYGHQTPSGDSALSASIVLITRRSFGAESQITTLSYYITSIQSADFDLDGDLDLVTASLDSTIAWHENLDGQGTFGIPILISQSGLQPLYVVAVDIDSDCDFDAISSDRVSSFMGRVSWYENTTPNDCNRNGIPDSCEPDSDADGLIDACDLCPTVATGDAEFDGTVTISDVQPLVSTILAPNSSNEQQRCASDVDVNGLLDGRDLQQFVDLLLSE